MKIFLTLLFVFSIHHLFAQEWTTVKNAPTYKYRFDDIYYINDSIGWAVDGDGRIYKSNGKNNPWTLQFITDQYMRSIEFIDDSTGFAGSVDAAYYKTTNAGKTWVRIDTAQSFTVPGICGISHLGDAVIMVGAYFGSACVVRSFDRGKTWSYTDMVDYAQGLVDVWYKSADTVFVSGISATNKLVILRSADKGNTWTDLTPTGNMPSGWGWKWHFPTASVGYVAIEEVTIQDVPTSNSTHFLKSTDGGRSWKLMEAKIGKNIDLQGLGFATANRGWIGGWSTGMYETNDGGLTWKLINKFANLNRFFFLRSDFGYVSGTTIFQFKKGVITEVEATEPSVDAHSLEIFPNPAGHQTTARLTLGMDTHVVISLLDINGSTVKEMYNGYAGKGVHDYKIEVEKLPTGEYIVQALTHEHFLAKRLLKIKN
ncbi:MAG: hypothetical protein JST48_12550 [Bacteroidetes bacterium]|nr:hypothetical protein [Bacteroidota bacterium]